MNKTIKKETIENFEVKYKKHPFSKSIKISLKKEGQVLVTMPYLCPFRTAKEFLLSNLDKLKEFKLEEKKLSSNLSTKFDTLKLIQSDILKTVVKNNIVYFYYPNNIKFEDDIIQKALKKLIIKQLQLKQEIICRLG